MLIIKWATPLSISHLTRWALSGLTGEWRGSLSPPPGLLVPKFFCPSVFPLPPLSPVPRHAICFPFLPSFLSSTPLSPSSTLLPSPISLSPWELRSGVSIRKAISPDHPPRASRRSFARELCSVLFARELRSVLFIGDFVSRFSICELCSDLFTCEPCSWFSMRELCSAPFGRGFLLGPSQKGISSGSFAPEHSLVSSAPFYSLVRSTPSYSRHSPPFFAPCRHRSGHIMHSASHSLQHRFGAPRRHLPLPASQ